MTPSSRTNIEDLIKATNEAGSFDLETNNCVMAVKRMIQKMGRLEEVLSEIRSRESIDPEAVREILREAGYE
ncbi:hypothetical protein Ddc_00405 [Ditylenchus destructor]|nr:hypothetical protein Ddc_00405 [Ditylenchus destructor]